MKHPLRNDNKVLLLSNGKEVKEMFWKKPLCSSELAESIAYAMNKVISNHLGQNYFDAVTASAVQYKAVKLSKQQDRLNIATQWQNLFIVASIRLNTPSCIAVKVVDMPVDE